MKPTTVLCWKWQPRPGYRSTFGPETVNVLRAMVRRHFPHPHRFVCVTDDPDGIDADIEIVSGWNDFADVPSPHGGKNPSCYRRLRMFHPQAGERLGERFVSLDLDTVIVNDVTSLWDRPEDVVFYGDTNPKPGSHYNGSMMLIRAGSRPQVWNRFDPQSSPQASLRGGSWGSDQGWISHCLGGKEAKWTKADGVYSFRNDFRLKSRADLPANARLIVFHGNEDPWSDRVQRDYAWVRDHYRVMDQEAVA